MNKKCSKCKMLKAFIDFSIDRQKKDGYTSSCKECMKLLRSPPQFLIPLPPDTKICFMCNTLRNILYFSKNKYKLDGLQTICKLCMRQYRIDNETHIKHEKIKYRAMNKSVIRERDAEYYEKNKQNCINRQVAYVRKRKTEDVIFRLTCNLRRRFHNALKSNYKNGSAVRDLGCSIEYFVNEYMPSLFQLGMSWGNYGKWHLDHIIPLSSFDLTDREQFLKACHYTNYQPLWAIDNLRKGSKI